MNANYAEICRVGNLEADFQHSTCSIFLKFSQYCCETLIIQIQQRKVRTVFFDKNSKKSLYYRNCIGFFAVNLILGYTFENKTQKQKRQMVSDKIWSIRTKYFHLK